jgi:hypothetical protein
MLRTKLDKTFIPGALLSVLLDETVAPWDGMVNAQKYFPTCFAPRSRTSDVELQVRTCSRFLQGSDKLQCSFQSTKHEHMQTQDICIYLPEILVLNLHPELQL